MTIFNKTATDAYILTELGRRLAQHRLAAELSQAELAELAGVSKRTLERVEAGNSTQLATLIRLLRVLGLLNGLDQLLPAQDISPMALLGETKAGYAKSKTRRRVSRKRQQGKSGKGEKEQPWTWGDEP